MINKDWARWIHASVNRHFETHLTGLDPLTVFYEGNHRATEKEPAILEVRQDGGYWSEEANGYWRGTYEVNIVAQRVMDDQDNYKIWDLIGLACEAMTRPISVFKYGGPRGDDTLLKCFERIKEKEEVFVHYFGQIDPNIKLVQATIEVHYSIELRG